MRDAILRIGLIRKVLREVHIHVLKVRQIVPGIQGSGLDMYVGFRPQLKIPFQNLSCVLRNIFRMRINRIDAILRIGCAVALYCKADAVIIMVLIYATIPPKVIAKAFEGDGIVSAEAARTVAV